MKFWAIFMQFKSGKIMWHFWWACDSETYDFGCLCNISCCRFHQAKSWRRKVTNTSKLLIMRVPWLPTLRHWISPQKQRLTELCTIRIEQHVILNCKIIKKHSVMQQLVSNTVAESVDKIVTLSGYLDVFQWDLDTFDTLVELYRWP